MKNQNKAVSFILAALSAAAAVMLSAVLAALAYAETTNDMLTGFKARNAVDGVALEVSGGDAGLAERFAALPDTVSVFKAAAEASNPIHVLPITAEQTEELDAHANEAMYDYIRTHALTDELSPRVCARIYTDDYLRYGKEKGYITTSYSFIDKAMVGMKTSQLVTYMNGDEFNYAFTTVKAGDMAMTAAIAGGDPETVQQYLDAGFRAAIVDRINAKYAAGFIDYLNGGGSYVVNIPESEKLSAMREFMSDVLAERGYDVKNIEENPLDDYLRAYLAENKDLVPEALTPYDEVLDNLSEDRNVPALVNSALSSSFRTVLKALAAVLVLLIALLRYSGRQRTASPLRRGTRWMTWTALAMAASALRIFIKSADLAKNGLTGSNDVGSEAVNAIARAASSGLDDIAAGILAVGLGLLVVRVLLVLFSGKKKTA